MRRPLASGACLVLLACLPGLVASACGARSELAEAGVGASCAAQPCTPVGPGGPVWSQFYGSAGQQAAHSIAFDGVGNLVVAGNLFGPSAVDFGCGALTEPPGATGMFVAKLDRCGACAWSRAFHGASTIVVAVSAAGDVVVNGSSLAGSIDLGGGTVLTSPGPEAFVAELDGSGSLVWAKGIGGADADASCQVTGVVVDGSGNVLVAGSFIGSIDFGGDVLTSPDGQSTVVAKLGPDGTAAWSRTFGPNVFGGGVATDASGDVLFTGSLETPIDFGCGTLEGMENHSSQPFVVELDAGGVCRWSRSFPATGGAQSYGIATDASSNVVVTGLQLDGGSIDLGGGPIQATGLSDSFVVALHADGSFRWGKDFGNTQIGAALAVNGAGEVFLDGVISGPTDLGGGTLDASDPIFVASLDAMGGYRWANTFAAATTEISVIAAGGLAVDSSSRLLFTGGIEGTIDFGCGSLTSAGALDVFVVELAQ
jgi:hypothetical protein